MTTMLPALLFTVTALTAIVVLVRQFAMVPALVRAVSAGVAECPDTREVRFTFRTLDVVPEGGTVVRGRFSSAQRRAVPQAVLPAAA